MSDKEDSEREGAMLAKGKRSEQRQAKAREGKARDP